VLAWRKQGARNHRTESGIYEDIKKVEYTGVATFMVRPNIGDEEINSMDKHLAGDLLRHIE
jgi:hypothetical protein